jgi:signal transduction histidine kinase
LAKEDSNITDCKNNIEEINSAALDMIELVNDMLDVGKIELTADFSHKIDISQIVKKAVRLNYAYALRRGIAIKTVISDALNPVKLDAKKLKQVLTNLISNAVKYSDEGTEIVVSAYCKSSKLIIAIKDQGFGMSQDQIATAFEKYKVIENPNSKKVDSFGLGLPIVKELVALMKGEIFVESQLEKGTEIILMF